MFFGGRMANKNPTNPTQPYITINHTIKNNQSKTYGLVYGNVGLVYKRRNGMMHKIERDYI
jgi:hypothetical protein